MFKKKTLASLGFSTLLVSGLLVGCGGSDTSSTKEDTTDKDNENQEQVEITLSGWGSSPTEQKLFEETLASFEEKNPHIKVKLDVIADQYMDVMKTRLIGGQAADVFFLDAFEAPALMETGVLEPLDGYITEDFDIDDFEQPLLDAFKRDGAIFGLPKDTSTLALFYNKTMFEEAGIENPPTTFEELQEVAKQLTQGTDVYGYGIVADLARNVFIAESKGGKIATDNKATFGSTEVVEALQPLLDMRLDDKSAAQPSEVGANWGGEMFGQGKVAMILEGNWTLPFLAETFPNLEFGTAEVPTIDGQNGTMAFTVAYVMNAQSEKKEAAWELISYLTGKEGMEQWTSGGSALPTRVSVAESLGLYDDEIRQPFISGASYATVWADDTNLPIINNNFNNQFTSAFLGQRPLDEALEEAERVANREIE
ncbi:ABC transporter substrate-binding protein [Alkalihalobacterium chitinilyticum]|uniref:ABC transporter substrate-binding protein n=1 Tax=Alkalihalobacterium chitinilyticum TaxID=2980103 RepID=A0ABT5VHX7_9BACI|nr:ABC transporter substrate-binding protein [Alkalihalobacterium chitinilyticum]MDE5415058.1 ABC transporter substrate-binding protein [Alkalihalobacterium chitinilyticum]